MENAANSVAYTSVQNADLQAHKAIEMGSVIVTYKVFPEDIVESFDALKKQIDNIKPEFASIEGYGEEEVAFGLIALLVQLKFPEDKSGIVDEFEEKLGKDTRRQSSAMYVCSQKQQRLTKILVFTQEPSIFSRTNT